METYLVSISVFTTIILSLVLILFLVEKFIIKAQDCVISINGDPKNNITVPSGTNLLTALSNAKTLNNQPILIPNMIEINKNIKFNNKIIHQSKLLNYFVEKKEISKIEKETNDLLKSILKDKK